jgi:hypothetical protein
VAKQLTVLRHSQWRGSSCFATLSGEAGVRASPLSVTKQAFVRGSLQQCRAAREEVEVSGAVDEVLTGGVENVLAGST